MGHSFVLLTASILASQVAEGQIVSNVDTGCNCGSGGQVRNGGGTFLDRFRSPRSYETVSPAPSNPGFFSRVGGKIGGLFGRSGNDGGFIQDGAQPVGVPISEPVPEMMHRMPNKTSFSEPPLSASETSVEATSSVVPIRDSGVAQVNFRSTASGTPGVSGAIHAKFIEKVGHEEDYSWITGQLAQEGNRWVIHYATSETVDRFGGKLVLAGTADMNSFQLGDLVTIHGSLINRNGGQGSAYLIQTINLVENK